jgi:hypothetical protein
MRRLVGVVIPPMKVTASANTADISVFVQDDLTDEAYTFETSRSAEVAGLIKKGTFKVVNPTSIPKDVRIFKSRFVDEMNKGGTLFEKSRLVVQAYDDIGKQEVLTQSPTIQRVSQRIILCLTPTMMVKNPRIQLFLRDITQAYVQSTTRLNRPIYIRPPIELIKQLNLVEDAILQVIKPLYGVPESGNHWFETYHSHHIDALSMKQSTFDHCLLYSNDPFGVVGLQTDDTLFLSDDKFAELEQSELEKARFLAKERESLTIEKDLKFNGAIIKLTNDGNITLTQERQCKNLKVVTNKDNTADTTSSRGITRKDLPTKERYIAQRARGAYIASVCQPEAAYDLSVAAQVVDVDDKGIKALNKRLQWQIDNQTRGLRFVQQNLETLKLYVFTDASFANNQDLSSQMGFLIALVDAEGNANIVHWQSVKCKRVTRSVLASELLALVHGFDMGTVIKATVSKILELDIPLVLCTDSRSLYHCLVKLGTTQEKRLMVDVMCMREAYERREITEVKWIDGNSNPADSMTKPKATTSLKQLIDTNKLDIKVQEWVERTGDNSTKTKGN